MTQTDFAIMEGIISFFLIIYIIKIIVLTRRVPGRKQHSEAWKAFKYFRKPIVRNSPKTPYV